MQFCQHCGAYLTLIVVNGKEVYGCPRCNSIADIETSIRKINNRKEAIITIGEDEANVQPMPKTAAECEKCGNKEAYYWQVQTRGGDEPMTRFYRCVKCNATWREHA